MWDDRCSEGLIVQYLLGDLPEEMQSEIEARAFQDQQVLQHILAVEIELIDQYVRGELRDFAHSQFECRFLASDERRRKIEFAKALMRITPESGF
jgi:anti-sigma factor RsiW